MKTIEIIEKEYLPEQQKLVDIFKQHAKSVMPELPIVFKKVRTSNKTPTHINRIPCKTIGGIKGFWHVSMTVIDFLRLMVKSGIEVQIYENKVCPNCSEHENCPNPEYKVPSGYCDNYKY